MFIKNFDISEIDIKRGTYELTIRQLFTYRFNQDYDENEVEKNHEIFWMSMTLGSKWIESFDVHKGKPFIKFS